MTPPLEPTASSVEVRASMRGNCGMCYQVDTRRTAETRCRVAPFFPGDRIAVLADSCYRA
ncbi:hypothetical protein [Streptosporangium sp. NPDC049078]|uniref:hypothetical protein n=1 Tax=Streptosporangium sp. NPDC049078 TaxID=3155767 RepID=UPI00341BC9C5